MGSFSLWHWLIVMLWGIAPMFPISEILKKAGYSRAWALLWLVPLVNLIGFVVFAYSRWPSTR
ncbi:MAG: hypothetical protein KKE52_03500 [Alphaproteobacteria bacterium]|nr:hypothetical protein [Alphaproteobacteria bacterium]MBU2270345.1 hypothetical protein [Alphaproteobacteria bacterium]